MGRCITQADRLHDMPGLPYMLGESCGQCTKNDWMIHFNYRASRLKGLYFFFGRRCIQPLGGLQYGFISWHESTLKKMRKSRKEIL